MAGVVILLGQDGRVVQPTRRVLDANLHYPGRRDHDLSHGGTASTDLWHARGPIHMHVSHPWTPPARQHANVDFQSEVSIGECSERPSYQTWVQIRTCMMISN